MIPSTRFFTSLCAWMSLSGYGMAGTLDVTAGVAQEIAKMSRAPEKHITVSKVVVEPRVEGWVGSSALSDDLIALTYGYPLQQQFQPTHQTSFGISDTFRLSEKMHRMQFDAQRALINQANSLSRFDLYNSQFRHTNWTAPQMRYGPRLSSAQPRIDTWSRQRQIDRSRENMRDLQQSYVSLGETMHRFQIDSAQQSWRTFTGSISLGASIGHASKADDVFNYAIKLPSFVRNSYDAIGGGTSHRSISADISNPWKYGAVSTIKKVLPDTGIRYRGTQYLRPGLPNTFKLYKMSSPFWKQNLGVTKGLNGGW